MPSCLRPGQLSAALGEARAVCTGPTLGLAPLSSSHLVCVCGVPVVPSGSISLKWCSNAGLEIGHTPPGTAAGQVRDGPFLGCSCHGVEGKLVTPAW